MTTSWPGGWTCGVGRALTRPHGSSPSAEKLRRHLGPEGKILNARAAGTDGPVEVNSPPPSSVVGLITEDEVKAAVRDHFEAQGYDVAVARCALALPDNRRDRGLVNRLPVLARDRLNLAVIWVARGDGTLPASVENR